MFQIHERSLTYPKSLWTYHCPEGRASYSNDTMQNCNIIAPLFSQDSQVGIEKAHRDKNYESKHKQYDEWMGQAIEPKCINTGSWMVGNGRKLSSTSRNRSRSGASSTMKLLIDVQSNHVSLPRAIMNPSITLSESELIFQQEYFPCAIGLWRVTVLHQPCNFEICLNASRRVFNASWRKYDQ